MYGDENFWICFCASSRLASPKTTFAPILRKTSRQAALIPFDPPLHGSEREDSIDTNDPITCQDDYFAFQAVGKL